MARCMRMCGFVGLVMVLWACGTPDINTPPSPLAPLPHAQSQQQPIGTATATPNLTATIQHQTNIVQAQTIEAGYWEHEQQMADLTMTSFADPRPTADENSWPTDEPYTVIPQPTPNFGLLTDEQCDGPRPVEYMGPSFTVNCWHGIVNGHELIVRAKGNRDRESDFLNGNLVISDHGEGYQYSYPLVENIYMIRAVDPPLMTISISTTTMLFNLETRRWITPVTLVVANPAALSESDQALQTFLAGRDYLPMLRTPSSITNTAVLTSHVVLLSSSVSASVAQTQFRDAPIPVMAWNPALYLALKLTTSAGTDTADQLVIEQAEHPLAAGLRDRVILYDKAVAMPYGVPSANAITIGYALVNERGVPPRSSYFAYEKGAVMADGVVAPARRVALPWANDGTPSDEAWKLLDAAIQWAGMP